MASFVRVVNRENRTKRTRYTYTSLQRSFNLFVLHAYHSKKIQLHQSSTVATVRDSTTLCHAPCSPWYYDRQIVEFRPYKPTGERVVMAIEPSLKARGYSASYHRLETAQRSRWQPRAPAVKHVANEVYSAEDAGPFMCHRYDVVALFPRCAMLSENSQATNCVKGNDKTPLAPERVADALIGRVGRGCRDEVQGVAHSVFVEEFIGSLCEVKEQRGALYEVAVVGIDGGCRPEDVGSQENTPFGHGERREFGRSEVGHGRRHSGSKEFGLRLAGLECGACTLKAVHANFQEQKYPPAREGLANTCRIRKEHKMRIRSAQR
ncbi:hypothetical protein C8R44DRAFT_738853 [Mycena epipterygia]|nr:hypothetical protein C8R44DRAFT_738853 [Mycena epipterygia]